MIDRIRQKFRNLFAQDPILVASPGRVNLIGEHTDYNEGYVLPAAIDKQILFGLAPNGTDRIRLHAEAFDQTEDFSLEQMGPVSGWPDYLLGVVAILQEQNLPVKGFDCVMGGDIPIGAGLSSSAALECGLAFGLNHLFGFGLDTMALARIGQQAEHQWVGVQCGIMDQFASLHGKKDQLIRLDCRSMEFQYIPFHFPGYGILLCNTMVDHSLASSQYNLRRQECEEGVAILGKTHPEADSLSDFSVADLPEAKKRLPSLLFQRCSYVIEENDRVLKSCELLRQGNLASFGKLMYESHEGLSTQYEVSCPELDFLVRLARRRPEVAGARMMGGGFGGCVIHIIRQADMDAFSLHVTEQYKRRFGREPEIYITSIESGTHLVET